MVIIELNYHAWRVQFLVNFIANQLVEYIEGAVSFDNPMTIQQDQIILGWFLSTISPTILTLVISYQTSYKVWNALKHIFALDSRSRIMSLKQQLQQIRKGNKSISEYMAELSKIIDSLAIAGEKTLESDKVL